jgi:hypothetical protein
MPRKRRHRPQPLVADDVVAPLESTSPSWPELLVQLVPELWLASLALAVALVPERVSMDLSQSLMLVPIGELFFCMAQGTLTDVATRLRKRPPLWTIPLILVALGVAYPDTVYFLRMTWGAGWPVFLPWLWSVVERGRELWTMPVASRLDKLRRRALVSGRMTLVLVGGAVGVAALIGGYLADPSGDPGWAVERLAPWGLAAAFLVLAWDVVRVHRPAFARRPRAVLPFIDPLHVRYLDPI